MKGYCGDANLLLTQAKNTRLSPCRRDCGVSTPIALPYLSSPPDYDGPKTQLFGNCRISALGLHLFDDMNESNKRIMDPIWVKANIPGADGELGARQIVCYDIDGFRQNIILAEEIMDSPQLFTILRDRRVHAPASKKEKGKVREFLVTQFPNPRILDDQISNSKFATAVAGWQADGSFLSPNASHSPHISSFKLKEQALPTGYTTKQCMEDLHVADTTSDPYVLLAVTASLAAPFLNKLNLDGICLHFYGNTEKARKALICAASSVWPTNVYQLPEAKSHVVGLKRQCKDSTLCIHEIHPNQTRLMHSFLRRFFYGRKGADEGVCGIVISSGEMQLARDVDRKKGVNAFIDKTNVLAIDICIESWRGKTLQVDQNLSSDITGHIGTLQDEWFISVKTAYMRFSNGHGKAKRIRASKQIVSFLGLCFAVGSFALSAKYLKWWDGSDLESVFNKLLVGIDSQDKIYRGFLKQLFDALPNKTKIGSFELKNATLAIAMTKNKVLFPARALKKILDDANSLRDFTVWLKKNRILISRGKVNLCEVYYSPKEKKPIRGYLLNKRRIIEVLEAKNTLRSTY